MEMEPRRSGNYPASMWNNDFVQSLASPYAGKEHVEQAEKLKIQAKIIIDETKDDKLRQLELVDILQRLGISYHFKCEIDDMLNNIYHVTESSSGDAQIEESLYHTALRFRLLRQHAYQVPQEVFLSFMDEDGNFEESLCDDVKGVLELYEASFLSVEAETILDLAKDYAIRCLKRMVDNDVRDDADLSEQIRHALELPLCWRVPEKLEAKWFIDMYEKRLTDKNLVLLELAKLDFNIVQSKYQSEINHLSSWYKQTGFEDKLSFARHRLLECFLWAVGTTPEPHLSYSRIVLTKIGTLITITDDICDVYGTLEEIEAFADTIERWETNSLDHLPEYMRLVFLALFNISNEIAYDILRDQGLNIIPNLRKLWRELTRAYYQEAKWYHSGYIPTSNGYLDLAWISISGPLLLFTAYFSMTNPIKEKELKSLERYPAIIYCPSMIIRLADDLATTPEEMKRGDNPKSLQCYMNEKGCSEDDARKLVRDLLETTVKKMNKDVMLQNKFKNFRTSALNLARAGMCFYHNGDGIGFPNQETKENLFSLLVNPIDI